MKNVSVLSIVSFIVNFVSFMCWFLCVGYYPPTYELYVLTWYLWVICGCIAPVLPIAAKHYRKTHGINHTFYKFLEVIALFVGYFDIKSAAVLNSDFQYLGLCATAVSIICIYFYFRRSRNSIVSTSDNKNEAAPEEIPEVTEQPSVVSPVKDKYGSTKILYIVLIIIVTICALAYFTGFYEEPYVSSTKSTVSNIDFSVDNVGAYMMYATTSFNKYGLDNTTDRPHPTYFVYVRLDDSFSDLSPAERNEEITSINAHIRDCIDDAWTAELRKEYKNLGCTKQSVSIKMETSNEVVFDKTGTETF